MTLSQFNEIWASTAYPPKPVAEADLRHVETCLSVRLPDDYRRAVLGSGLIDHSQKMTVAASATAEKKTVGQRS